MEKVTKGEAGGPQSADPATAKVLTEIYGNIKKLSYVKNPRHFFQFPQTRKEDEVFIADSCNSLLNGLIYKDKGLEPWSHISRLLNKTWGTDTDKSLSKFLIGAWPFVPKASDRGGRAPGWWSPYDLLGLFLSLLGPAPEAADKNNYFLPLTAVYARWCSRIAGTVDPADFDWKPTEPGVGDWPFMFQCTWNLIEDKSTKQRSKWFFLGASTAGDKFDPNEVGAWRHEVQRERFDMLFGCQRTGMVQSDDFSAKRAPSQVNPNGTQVPFGNCAETYPFVAMVQAYVFF